MLELLEAIVRVMGMYESEFVTSKICSFLQCKVDNDKIVDEDILALQFPSTFGKHCNNIVGVVHSFLSPDVVTLDINVNTNKIEGRWAHIRRHDGNRGGKFLSIYFSKEIYIFSGVTAARYKGFLAIEEWNVNYRESNRHKLFISYSLHEIIFCTFQLF